MLVSIIIIRLFINLISWYYYSCSAYDCVSRSKIYSARKFDETVNKITQEILARRSIIE